MRHFCSGRRVLFLLECGNNFGMPQVQLPIFPAGVTHINSGVAFEERDGKVYYFNGHLPVFVHEKSALSTFRLFSLDSELELQDRGISCGIFYWWIELRRS
jgi:hypothetical protein